MSNHKYQLTVKQFVLMVVWLIVISTGLGIVVAALNMTLTNGGFN